MGDCDITGDQGSRDAVELPSCETSRNFWWWWWLESVARSLVSRLRTCGTIDQKVRTCGMMRGLGFLERGQPSQPFAQKSRASQLTKLAFEGCISGHSEVRKSRNPGPGHPLTLANLPWQFCCRPPRNPFSRPRPSESASSGTMRGKVVHVVDITTLARRSKHENNLSRQRDLTTHPASAWMTHCVVT